jgi:PRTRC genetic system protein C
MTMTTNAAITLTPLKRIFEFNGVRWDDPGPEFSVEDVRETMSLMYPDLTTAIVEGPEIVGDTAVFKFIRNVGAKG